MISARRGLSRSRLWRRTFCDTTDKWRRCPIWYSPISAWRSMGIEKRLIVISCLHFVVGPVVIDPVILVKCTCHRLSVALFAQLNLEIGQRSKSTWLNICAACPMDLEMPAWGKRKSAEALQGQGRRALRQAVAEGRSVREVFRRLVEVLTTLSLVNVAELTDLTATVFKTYLVPSSENVAEAMAEAGRLYHDSAGAIKNKPEAERADAQDQLGPPFVHVWVASAAERGEETRPPRQEASSNEKRRGS